MNNNEMETILFEDSETYKKLDERISRLEDAVKELSTIILKEVLSQGEPLHNKEFNEYSINLDTPSTINIEAQNVYYNYTDSKELKEQDNE